MTPQPPYTVWARVPPGRWFVVGHADTEDDGWRIALAWRPPAGQSFDERTVLRAGGNPSARPR